MIPRPLSPAGMFPHAYCTDGLVLHLDALRPRLDGTLGSLSTWQDLSGNGHDVNLTSAVTFDGVNIPILTASGKIPTWVFRNDYYVEIVTVPPSVSGKQQVYALFSKSGAGVLTLSVGGVQIDGEWANLLLRTNGSASANPNNGVYSHRLQTAPLASKLYSFAVYYSRPLIYMNGVATATATLFNNYNYPSSGGSSDDIINNRRNICTPQLAALRVYSRELSHDEVMRNFHRDKARFHLC